MRLPGWSKPKHLEGYARTLHGAATAADTQRRVTEAALADDVWADFSRPAAALGVRSMLSFPLSDGQQMLGARDLLRRASRRHNRKSARSPRTS